MLRDWKLEVHKKLGHWELRRKRISGHGQEWGNRHLITTRTMNFWDNFSCSKGHIQTSEQIAIHLNCFWLSGHSPDVSISVWWGVPACSWCQTSGWYTLNLCVEGTLVAAERTEVGSVPFHLQVARRWGLEEEAAYISSVWKSWQAAVSTSHDSKTET